MTYKLQDLIDIEHFQNLQDRLNGIYSFPSAIIDNEGNILTATAWQDICTQFHRKNKDCERDCIHSDQYILSHLHEANPAVTYRCPRGLVDNATPIIIDGIHYGNFFTGQFFLEKPDMEFFRAQAKKYGFDEDAYLKAVEKVPIWTLEQLNSYLFFIKGLIAVISESGLKRLKEAEAKKQIEESEERANTILRQMHEGFWVTNPQGGRVVDANEAMCRMLGYTRDEMLKASVADVEANDSPEVIAQRMQHLIQTGSDHFESRFRRKDGTIFDVEVSVTYLPKRELFFGFHRDITERKRAEAALRESETHYRALVEGMPGIVYSFSTKRGGIYYSSHVMNLLGYSPEQLYAQPLLWHNSIHPDDLQRVKQVIRETSEGKPFRVEYRIRDERGNWHWFDDLSFGYQMDGPDVIINGLALDITERKRAEEQIRKLSSVVEQSPVSIVITDPAGAIEYVNPKFTQVTGYTSDEVRGKNPRVLKGDKTSADEYRRLWECITRGREWCGEFHNRKKTGEMYWEFASISPIVDASGRITHFLAVKEDITDRKALEDQFRQAQKLESIGQLAGGVAHDFNNILAATMMQLSCLQQNPRLDEETQAVLKELTLEANRAASLTRQLLMFSRRSVLEVKVLDLNDVVANLLKMLRRLIGEHIRLCFDHRDGLPPVEADPGMIEQVLMNLAVNARDAMPKGGRLTISVEPVLVDAERVKGNIEVRPGQFVCLSVADTGCGMDEATLKRIFEPFFTTKDAGKGTGLGLATVYGIVAQHKGWVEVESEPGRGATFKVFLPATAKGRIEPIPTGKMAVLRGCETILLVEDEASVRRAVAQGLRRLGYRVLEAGNGQAAMKLWQEHDGQVDLLFSDMVMPEGMTGLDLAEKLQEEKPKLKVIISSGYNAEMAGHSRPAAGGIVYLQKPYQIEALSKTIRDCLDRA